MLCTGPLRTGLAGCNSTAPTPIANLSCQAPGQVRVLLSLWGFTQWLRDVRSRRWPGYLHLGRPSRSVETCGPNPCVAPAQAHGKSEATTTTAGHLLAGCVWLPTREAPAHPIIFGCAQPTRGAVASPVSPPSPLLFGAPTERISIHGFHPTGAAPEEAGTIYHPRRSQR